MWRELSFNGSVQARLGGVARGKAPEINAHQPAPAADVPDREVGKGALEFSLANKGSRLATEGSCLKSPDPWGGRSTRSRVPARDLSTPSIILDVLAQGSQELRGARVPALSGRGRGGPLREGWTHRVRVDERLVDAGRQRLRLGLELRLRRVAGRFELRIVGPVRRGLRTPLRRGGAADDKIAGSDFGQALPAPKGGGQMPGAILIYSV